MMPFLFSGHQLYISIINNVLFILLHWTLERHLPLIIDQNKLLQSPIDRGISVSLIVMCKTGLVK
jgi:hypothetical protein